jgi:hypothetical protein
MLWSKYYDDQSGYSSSIKNDVWSHISVNSACLHAWCVSVVFPDILIYLLCMYLRSINLIYAQLFLTCGSLHGLVVFNYYLCHEQTWPKF